MPEISSIVSQESEFLENFFYVDYILGIFRFDD
jgi:hypothetical protein